MTIPEETQKLLRLLSQVILADGHVYETEIEALAQGANELGFTAQSGNPISSAQIRIWFNAYQQELNETWSKTPKDVALTVLILSLSDWPNKQAIIDVLEKISLADADFHKEEKTLISIVKAYWQYDGLDAPGATIDT